MPALGRRRSPTPNTWPGFVDALATMLMVIIFLLMVFVLGQFFLGQALSGRDATLSRLQNQVDELAELLSLERRASADLRTDLGLLSGELQDSVRTREELQASIRTLLQQTEDARDRAAAAEKDLQSAFQTIMSDKATLEEQTSEIARVAQQLAALRALKAELEKEIAEQASRLDQSEEKLSEAAAATLREREISETARAQIALLNQQMATLRNQIASLQQALEASERESTDQKVQIADLGKRLNSALAAKVNELARYRSEFFGRLREIIGNRADVRIVGDRFVFQSEVLFETGSADLGDKGREEIGKLGRTLLDIAQSIPDDINWVLRIDGHTDNIPIATAQYASNWELSSARAISVVRALIASGVPANRLVAAGFGEFQPIDARGDEIARRRNRRIEIKLTER